MWNRFDACDEGKEEKGDGEWDADKRPPAAAAAAKAGQPEEKRVCAESDDPGAVYDALVADLQRVVVRTERACDIRSRHDLSCDLLRDIRRSAGDLRLASIQSTLNNLGYTRSVHQTMFHENFIDACLPIIFGEDWPMACDRVMAERKIERIRPEVLVQTPRRFGKTVSVAMYITAVLMNCPGIRVCVFSTGKRASSGLMLEILDRLRHIPGGRERVIKHNQVLSTILHAHKNKNSIRVCFFF